MTKINAMVVADSKNPQGDRITTMMITFPRFILAELNTHRMLSKNSASSRAIPFKTMLENVRNNPFVPIAFQKEHKGMQGTEYLEGPEAIQAEQLWLNAKARAITSAIDQDACGVTKQLCNRLLEPFMWHTVLVTSTEWENFFHLRCPQYSLLSEQMPISFRSRKDFLKYVHQVEAEEFKNQFDNLSEVEWLQTNKGQAEIHMMALAEAMWDAMTESTPVQLEPGEWHVPFAKNLDLIELAKLHPDADQFQEVCVKIATAMAARTSYTVVGDEKEFSYEKQIELHDRMANQVPFHASPFEHCARAMHVDEYSTYYKGILGDATSTREGYYALSKNEEGWCRNFKGFIQYREILETSKYQTNDTRN